MSEWMPIETAPKDGTEILVSYVDGRGRRHMTICRWYEYSADCAFWTNGTIDVDGDYIEHDAAHWQPLPEPPDGEP